MVDYVTAVWGIQFNDPSRKLVAVLIADMANQDGEAWPSLGFLASRCELHPDSVRRHIRAMENDGILRREERFSKERQTSNLYIMAPLATLASMRGVAPMQGGVSAQPLPGTHARGEGGTHATPLIRQDEPLGNPPGDGLGDLDIPETPLTSFETKSKPKAPLVTDQFETFWQAYPKEGRAGKPAALKAFKKHAKLLPEILAGLAKHAASSQWKKEKGRFIPNPATFLNQERWNDEPKNDPAPANLKPNRASAGNAGTANATIAKRY